MSDIDGIFNSNTARRDERNAIRVAAQLVYSISRRECLCVYPSKRIHVAVCGPIGIKFGKHMQIHLEKVVGKIKICPVSRRGNLWGFRGSEIENVGNLPNGWTD